MHVLIRIIRGFMMVVTRHPGSKLTLVTFWLMMTDACGSMLLFLGSSSWVYNANLDLFLVSFFVLVPFVQDCGGYSLCLLSLFLGIRFLIHLYSVSSITLGCLEQCLIISSNFGFDRNQSLIFDVEILIIVYDILLSNLYHLLLQSSHLLYVSSTNSKADIFSSFVVYQICFQFETLQNYLHGNDGSFYSHQRHYPYLWILFCTYQWTFLQPVQN